MSEKEDSHPEFVKWFSELNKNSGSVAGGKGANLSEIYNIGINVPQGFVVTAQAYEYLIEKSGTQEKILELVERISYEDSKGLEEITSEIRKIIEGIKIPHEMEEEIEEAYETLSAAENSDLKDKSANFILKKSAEPAFVAVRSSATTEDLANASFAGQQETYLNIKGKTELLKHIKKCFSSLFTPRATFYRNRKGFEHDKSRIAVIIQKMIDSEKSGVIFSKDPSGRNKDIVIEAVWGLGEGIVSGKITPDKYIVSQDFEIKNTEIKEKKIAITRDSSGKNSVVKLKPERSKQQVLKNHEIKKLAQIAIKLEEHYGKPQDIEFSIDGEEIYIVQTRPITTIQEESKNIPLKLKGEIILKGLGASPGIGVGKIKIIKNLKDLSKVQKGDILVTEMTNPDMVIAMQKSEAIVTDEGGLTAHAAIVSREMGIPAVVGTQEATSKLKEEEIITVNGLTGEIYKGKVSESIQKEILPVTSKTKTKIKVILDLPSVAKRASQTGLKSVGLARIEGIIAESGKHPEYFLKNKNIENYEKLIEKGIKEIGKYFDEIWVRTSDVRSDEFAGLEGAPKKKEANPMLGMHGIRYGIKNPEILKAELKAMKNTTKEGIKIGILLPQVISVFEVQEAKKFLQEIEFREAKIGVMIETPASIQLIRDFCEEGIDFISFGTNDLTQYILAVDRGNEQVQGLYNEMHPAILYQLGYVLRVAKKYNVETSICGQAGSKEPMVKFLVEKGIDSISVNADMAKKISDYIYELEIGQQPEEKEEIEKRDEDIKEDIEENIKKNTQENEDDKEFIPPQEDFKKNKNKDSENENQVSESQNQTLNSEGESEELPFIRGATSPENQTKEPKEETNEESNETPKKSPEKSPDEHPGKGSKENAEKGLDIF